VPQPGSINNIVPAGPDFLVRKIHDLEARLNRLETANVGNTTTIDGAPGLQITGGGSLKVIDPSTGTVVFDAAGSYGFSDGSGRSQAGVVFRRARRRDGGAATARRRHHPGASLRAGAAVL